MAAEVALRALEDRLLEEGAAPRLDRRVAVEVFYANGVPVFWSSAEAAVEQRHRLQVAEVQPVVEEVLGRIWTSLLLRSAAQE